MSHRIRGALDLEARFLGVTEKRAWHEEQVFFESEFAMSREFKCDLSTAAIYFFTSPGRVIRYAY